jgi:hypothetical protein
MNRRTFIVAAADTAAAATFTSNVITADQRIRVNGATRLYIKDSAARVGPS